MGDETGEIRTLRQYLDAKKAGSLNGNTYTFQSKVPLAGTHLFPHHYTVPHDFNPDGEIPKEYGSKVRRFLRAEIIRDSGKDIVEVLLLGHLDDRAVA